MGEVLENGVYLPDEGERNAYNGLKGNWNTVDTVVAQVQALSSTGLIRKPVDELPTEDIETNVIYMLKAVKPNGDVYRIEYMYIDGHWDALGTSETTLDDYYTKAETDDLPAVKSGINATRVSNYDAHLANNDIHVTLANKATWDGKQNALDTNQTAAVNSGVTAAKVTGYDTHVSDTDIHVTTSDKTAWNAKQDGLSQTQLAAVDSGITEAKRTGYDSHVADTDVHVTTADKAAWNGKQNALTQTQLDNIAAIPDKADSADLATVATTGDYGDLLNAPTIPTVNNASLTIQKNGTDVATFTANASSNVTANLAIPTKTSELDNDAGFLTQHNPVDNELSATSENALQNKVVKSELDGKAPLVHTHAASDVTSGTFNIARIPNLDASKITSGTIDIARLPKGALERLVKVANQAARYALTTDDVQLGDTVQQLDTGVMYVVTDETKLDSADGYTEFTAGAASSVPWTGVTGKPNDYPPSSHTHTKSQITDFPALATVAISGSYNDLSNIPASFTPSSHTHGNVTNDGKLGTASRALITDGNKKITTSSVTSTELGYVSGVTSAIQTQLNGKSASNHVHGSITNDGKLGTTANKPLITGTDGVVQAGSFGNAANTFCEGNDSRLSDARTPVAHTHTKSDVTDLFNSANTWTGNQYYTGMVILNSSSDVAEQFKQKLPKDVSVSTDALVRFNTLTDSEDHNVIVEALGHWSSYVSKSTSLKYKNDSTKQGTIDFRLEPSGSGLFYPQSPFECSLGNSGNQWNNLYAKNYYYNGTAWGLDKANEWTQEQTYSTGYYGQMIWLKNTNLDLSVNGNTGLSDTYQHIINWVDKNKTAYSMVQSWTNSSENVLVLRSRYRTDANTVRTSSIRNLCAANAKRFYPETDADTDLGITSNRWKTLNGINPGALSLPVTALNNTYDISGDITDLTGGNNSITAARTGWIFVKSDNATEIAIANTITGMGASDHSATAATLMVSIPVTSGETLNIIVNCTSIDKAYLLPCQGNV